MYMKVSEFTVNTVPHNQIRWFIKKHHYSNSTRGLHISYCFGLFRESKFGIPELIGAMIYGLPAMPSVSAKYYPDNPDIVLELNRLCCIDDTPTNTESFFIGQTLQWLKQNTEYKVIVSFADTAQGHEGIIYKATNFTYFGMTSTATQLIADGEVYHSRMLSKKCPKFESIKRRRLAGDPDITTRTLPSKHIYVYALGKKIKKNILKHKNDNS